LGRLATGRADRPTPTWPTADDGKVTIQVQAISQAGFDPSWLRNAVDEPLDEADIER
jgi:hypothetical protein